MLKYLIEKLISEKGYSILRLSALLIVFEQIDLDYYFCL